MEWLGKSPRTFCLCRLKELNQPRSFKSRPSLNIFAVPALLALLILINTSFGEITTVHDGIGWDGRIYADAVKFLTNTRGDELWYNERNPVTIGTKFSSEVNGSITGIGFYKNLENTGRHIGLLYSATGALLAQAPFEREAASGWQQVDFSPPPMITANTTYVVALFTTTGFAHTSQALTADVYRPPLRIPATAAAGGNGVFAIGAAPQFPYQPSASEKYWLDVTFSADGGMKESTIWSKESPAVADFPRTFYHLQRILPSFIAAILIRMAGITATDADIIIVFKWINCVLLIAAIYLFYGVTRRLELSGLATTIALAFLFVSFPVQKQFIFAPVTTDCAALFLAVALLYSHLCCSRIGLLLVSAAGAFTWPPVSYSGVLLLLFHRRPVSNTQSASGAALIASVLISWSAFCLFVMHESPNGYVQSMLPLSFCVSAAALWGAYYGLSPAYRDIADALITTLKSPAIYLVIAAVTAINIALKLIGRPGGVNIPTEIGRMSVEHLAKPGIAIVAATMYFGPFMILAARKWTTLCRLIKHHGLGLILVCMFCVAQLLLDSETRRTLVLLPIFAAFTAKVYDDANLTLRWTVAFIALSFAFSRLWMPINAFGGTSDDPLSFPLQLFFSAIGPWMSNTSYVWQGSIVLLLAIALSLSIRRIAPEITKRAQPISGIQ